MDPYLIGYIIDLIPKGYLTGKQLVSKEWYKLIRDKLIIFKHNTFLVLDELRFNQSMITLSKPRDMFGCVTIYPVRICGRPLIVETPWLKPAFGKKSLRTQDIINYREKVSLSLKEDELEYFKWFVLLENIIMDHILKNPDIYCGILCNRYRYRHKDIIEQYMNHIIKRPVDDDGHPKYDFSFLVVKFYMHIIGIFEKQNNIINKLNCQTSKDLSQYVSVHSKYKCILKVLFWCSQREFGLTLICQQLLIDHVPSPIQDFKTQCYLS